MKTSGFRRKSWQELLAQEAEKKKKKLENLKTFTKKIFPIEKKETFEIVYYKDMSSGKTRGMKRTRLKRESDSEVAVIKRDIQKELREGVIARDGGCFLRHFPEAGQCFDRRKDGELILQAEHLVTRSNSNTFADLRNAVCICRGHHLYFKPQHSFLYWKLVERFLGDTRWRWFKLAEADKKPYKVDWKLSLLALKQEVEKLKKQI